MVFPQEAHILEEGQACPNNQGAKSGGRESARGPEDRGLFAWRTWFTEEVAFGMGEGGSLCPRCYGKKAARVEGSAQAKVWKLDCSGPFRSMRIGRQDESVREETVVGGALMSAHPSTCLFPGSHWAPCLSPCYPVPKSPGREVWLHFEQEHRPASLSSLFVLL